jgi:DNA-3-methyladenine glycosylase II
MDDLPPLDAFGTLIFQVVGQQLSVASTRTIVARIEALFGRRCRRRRSCLRPIPKAFAGMADDDVEAALTEVPGIGPWSAHGFLLVALDRPDVFLTGDIALRRAIQRLYGFDRVPTENELEELSDRWRPFRSLAVSYLFAAEYE